MPDTTRPTPDRVTAIYDAIDAFQRTHRLPGFQHAQLRGLLAEHLARALTAVPSAPAARAELRDRIAEALYVHDHPGWRVSLSESDTEPVYRERAVAVLAVLPAPVDRAAVLHEAADKLTDVSAQARKEGALDWTGYEAAALLRRMADEEQQPETETQAQPPTTCWHLEILDGIWASYGPIYADLAEAVAHYRRDNEQRPTWKDVTRTPVQRRLVRATTTYTVEAEHPSTGLAERIAAKRQEPAFVQLADAWSTDGGPAGEEQPTTNTPRRGDQFETWLKRQRDSRPRRSHAWFMVDCVLDLYRLHADTGTPLSEHVCEGQTVGDCECLEQSEARPETVHGCPPDGSGLTPCCGRTPFELPLGDRISSEAPVTCHGAAVAEPGKEQA